MYSSRTKIRSKDNRLDRKSQLYQTKLENLFGPISIVKEVSSPAAALYPNTVPSVGKSTDEMLFNQSEQGHDLQQQHSHVHHLSAYPPGRRRVHENVLYNKNRDLSIKPSPYSLSTNRYMDQKVKSQFPWEVNRTVNAPNWIFEDGGKWGIEKRMEEG